MPNICDPSPEFASHHRRWKRSRDVISGEDAVKAGGEAYLPRPSSRMSDAEYQRYLFRVDFFPGACRTHDGNIGLVMRKPPVLEGAQGYEAIFKTLTDRFDHVQLSRFLLSETLITNFTGLLADAPPQPAGLSKAEAITLGYRPRLAPYCAESILDLVPMIIGNDRVIGEVRLLDSCKQVRHLKLTLIPGSLQPIYTVTLHTLVNGEWIEGETVTPLSNGVPLNRIPFRIVSTEAGAWTPPKGPLDDLVLVNLQHYRAKARLGNVLAFVGHPQRFITGLSETDDEDYIVSVDNIWIFKGGSKDQQPVDVGISEHSGKAVGDLRADVDSLKDEMAAIGSRILQQEKAAAEAAETLAIRRASENSLLAGMVNA